MRQRRSTIVLSYVQYLVGKDCLIINCFYTLATITHFLMTCELAKGSLDEIFKVKHRKGIIKAFKFEYKF